jgi:hypothetical protein
VFGKDLQTWGRRAPAPAFRGETKPPENRRGRSDYFAGETISLREPPRKPLKSLGREKLDFRISLYIKHLRGISFRAFSQGLGSRARRRASREYCAALMRC